MTIPNAPLPKVLMKQDELIGKVIEFEQGALDEGEIVELFQGLIDSGLAWELQGSYGRMAQDLIETGKCTTATYMRKETS